MTVRAKPRLLARKSIEALQIEAGAHGLKRGLSALNLVFLGIGCILGAGIYVMTGTAAANFAGPAVILSFVIAGVACGLTALCYAELASTMPVSGPAYTYCYAAIGEVAAWLLGWLILFEYGLEAALLAVGFSGYLVSLVADFGIIIPAATGRLHLFTQLLRLVQSSMEPFLNEIIIWRTMVTRHFVDIDRPANGAGGNFAL